MRKRFTCRNRQSFYLFRRQSPTVFLRVDLSTASLETTPGLSSITLLFTDCGILVLFGSENSTAITPKSPSICGFHLFTSV